MALEPQPFPDTAALGDHDVVVAVRSAGVNWVDVVMTSGQYQHLPEVPYTPGLEYAGDVAWIGAAVSSLAVGDRVLVDALTAGPRSSGAYRRYGGFASYAVAPESSLLVIPGELSYDQACNLLGNYETAYHCLVARGRLAAGETVLVLGASGATGLAAIHVARLVGATTIAVGRSADKLAIVRAQGADHTVELVEPASLRERVKAIAPKGVDVVYDGVGGEISVEALRCLRFGGRFLIVGWAATPNVSRGKGQRGAPNANQLPTNLIMMKGIDVLGAPTVIGTTNDPSLRPPRLAQLLAWVTAGQLQPYVSAHFPLEAWREAMLAKLANTSVGGIALRP